MGFELFETSRTKGETITLVHFFFVNNREYFYTDAETSITKEGFSEPFIPMPLQVGSVTSSGTLDKSTLEIRLPRRAAIAEGFRAYPPSEVVNVVVRQMHRDDPVEEALVAWTGRILGVSWEASDEITLSCEPVSTSLKRSGLRRNYQIGCPHALYSQTCAASKAAATTPDIVVESVSGSTVVLPNGWLPGSWLAAGKTVEKFVNGMLTWSYPSASGTVEQSRTILSISSGVNVLVAGLPVGLISGMSVKLVLGCSHKMEDCAAVHGNIKNFGGQPWIPVKSPFGFNNNFY